MGYRKEVIATGEIYHIFNRGVEKRPIVTNGYDCRRWVETIGYYQFAGVPSQFSLKNLASADGLPKQIRILAYCLMPNHFHLLVEQLVDGGISTFMQRAMLSYSRYYNLRHDRVGPLMQGPYRIKRITTTELLAHVSRYFHLNPVVANIVREPEAYRWSSMNEYLGLSPSTICEPNLILNQFSSVEKYKTFVHDQIDYARSLDEVKHSIWS